jgi:hypothetical protein
MERVGEDGYEALASSTGVRYSEAMLDIKTHQNTAHDMVEVASRLFKQQYGVWPDRIGLDWFTRMGEYAAQYGETYVANELLREVKSWTPDTIVTYERVAIKIVPAVFEELTKHPLTGLVQKPSKGRDEVLCGRGDITVFMTIWFSENGHDAIMWDTIS